ncbi:ABC transporter ATP-binding protein [Actinotignum sp. GS-2025a]|uniref:ABC transporter ATP-binding protein n=1 Tax=unclassified Actinotignum TaxID=2632702 RepID=UPI003F48C4DA
MGDVLSLKDVSLRRGATEILRSVSWDVNSGERWVIFGPNGAGKTTLIQVAAARLFPSSGSVELMGERLGTVDVRELRSAVGVTSAGIDARIPGGETVFQAVRTAAYGHLAAWNEEYDAADDARARAMLRRLGLRDLEDRKVAHLSSGERKRLGIARALMPNPEVLILDEPTSGLDLGGRERLLATLSRLAGAAYAPAMLLVTHHVEEIPVGFTHMLLLKAGGVVAAGPLAEVLTSAQLSQAFDYPLRVEENAGRYTARAAR